MKIKLIALATVFLLLFGAVALELPASASMGMGLSPATAQFGNVTRGSVETITVKVYNTGTTAYTYKITSSNKNITVKPSKGKLAANSSVTITLRLKVPKNAKKGNYSAVILVVGSAKQSGGLNIGIGLGGSATYTVV